MPRLVLGPLLRHVDQDSATVWVETDRPCEVEVCGRTARTFDVSGHHYALVVLRGLEPGSSTAYEVHLDGRRVWPEPGSSLPASRIRTLAGERFQVVFGSCRKPGRDPRFGSDALVAYAGRLATLDESRWPESLLLLGDQVYADETTRQTRRWLAGRRDLREPPGHEVADFEEYAHLYREAWSDPMVRWLMSTVPTSMIFDDHDVRDDWNTSASWRGAMAGKSWWRERLRGALVSYWVYQHIGNLDPDTLAADPLFAEVTTSGTDNAATLREFADRADAEVGGLKGTRWSYRRDFGRVRLLVIDTRSGRILEGHERSMLSEPEFAWIEENARGDLDHLLIGSSLPWLLPHAVADLQAVNERACDDPGRRGGLAERVRQAGDLEHWASFQTSFARLAGLLEELACADGGPATVAVLSGDVHHTYVAEAVYARPHRAPVHQLTCSPVHNRVPALIRLLFHAGWWEPLATVTRWLARRAGIRRAPVEWARTSGPHFGNMIATIDISGRDAVAILEHAAAGRLTRTARVPLTRKSPSTSPGS